MQLYCLEKVWKTVAFIIILFLVVKGTGTIKAHAVLFERFLIVSNPLFTINISADDTISVISYIL